MLFLVEFIGGIDVEADIRDRHQRHDTVRQRIVLLMHLELLLPALRRIQLPDQLTHLFLHFGKIYSLVRHVLKSHHYSNPLFLCLYEPILLILPQNAGKVKL